MTNDVGQHDHGMSGPVFAVGGRTAYDDVVRFTTAVRALRPLPEIPHPDFLFFQTLHLTAELLWYNMHFDIVRAADDLDRGDYLAADRLVRRATELQRLTVTHLGQVRSGIPQTEFLQIRATLPEGGSGLDSPGMRNLQKACRHLWRCFSAAMLADGAAQEAQLLDPETKHPGLRAVALQMLELDDAILAWQQEHQRMVWARLGGHPTLRALQGTADGPVSLTGRSVDVLDRFVAHMRFPRLWQAVQQHQESMSGRPAVTADNGGTRR
jgi:tryptophan 2,3-dioxygenase